MAFVKNPVAAKLANNIIEDVSANGTAQANVLSGAGTIYMIRIDNSANSAETVYLKIYDATSATPGTTRPAGIFACPASSSRQYSIPDGIVLSSGLTYAVVKTAGLQGNDTNNPSGTVKLYIATS
tara:strand:- start:236 stop:610 length:375 start_codon:yes stop_codon:yes gene_type:complete